MYSVFIWKNVIPSRRMALLPCCWWHFSFQSLCFHSLVSVVSDWSWPLLNFLMVPCMCCESFFILCFQDFSQICCQQFDCDVSKCRFFGFVLFLYISYFEDHCASWFYGFTFLNESSLRNFRLVLSFVLPLYFLLSWCSRGAGKLDIVLYSFSGSFSFVCLFFPRFFSLDFSDYITSIGMFLKLQVVSSYVGCWVIVIHF